MDFIITHYKEIIALIGSLTGLAGLILTFYSKHRDANIKDKELELKKEQFELEKKHQISKEKYQELFEQKITVYQKLYTEINKFRKQLYEIGKFYDTEDENGQYTMEQLSIEEANIKALLSIFSLVDENHFLVSNNLMQSYQNLYNLYRESRKDFELMYDVDAIDNPKKVLDEIHDEFYEKYQKSIQNFFSIIELEIKQIKQVLES